MLAAYLRALQESDWAALHAAVAPDVRRVGPFGDVVEGREAYVAFLSGLLPTLKGYALTVTEVHDLPAGGAFVELTEAFEIEGRGASSRRRSGSPSTMTALCRRSSAIRSARVPRHPLPAVARADAGT